MKLLRQIEMVQTQHAIASQNWQRIEGSLQLRNEALEKEKIDLTKRLEDERKKVKEAVIFHSHFSPHIVSPPTQNHLPGTKLIVDGFQTEYTNSIDRPPIPDPAPGIGPPKIPIPIPIPPRNHPRS